MKTKNYNPSPIEVRFAEVLIDLKDKINNKLVNFDVVRIDNNTDIDNPILNFHLKDVDGDEHKIVLKIIQTPDPE